MVEWRGGGEEASFFNRGEIYTVEADRCFLQSQERKWTSIL